MLFGIWVGLEGDAPSEPRRRQNQALSESGYGAPPERLQHKEEYEIPEECSGDSYRFGT